MRVDLYALDAVLDVLGPTAERCGADLLVVGAAARDVLLTTPPVRETGDLDFGVAVASAGDLATITDGLTPVPHHTNKFTVAGFEVDVVPFGGVEETDRTVWSEAGFVMNVLGYREALDSAVHVTLPTGRVAPVASLAAQVVLKVVAWDDRRHVTTKDALDLGHLLAEYREPRHVDEMYDRHLHRMERHDFDAALAAADRLGAEAAALLGPATTTLVALLSRECSDEGALPGQMGPDPTRNRALLQALLTGLAAG
jgi:predicted nucleotidyltransferase